MFQLNIGKVQLFSKRVFFFLLAFLPCVVSAQKGWIEGVVMDGEYAETLPGATVQLLGTSFGTVTDLDGKFRIENLPAGNYQVKFSYVSYEPITRNNVVIQSGKGSIVNVTLKTSSVQLEDVVVVFRQRTDGDIALNNAIRELPAVASGITAQFIRQTQDRDAGEAVKRIPGVSIIGDRFMVLRGLSQRYNSVWINGMVAPSSEADQRAFSFDVIPSSAIDNILISKTTSPEFPADFSGGFVKIKTKSIASNDGLSISLGTGYDTETTFRPFYHNPAGSLSFLGFNDGTLSIPDVAKGSFTMLNPNSGADRLATIAKSFNNQWEPMKRTSLPDLRISLNHSKQVYKEQNKEVSVVTSLNFSNGNSSDDKLVTNYGMWDESLNKPVYYSRNDQRIFKESAKLSLLHNWLFRKDVNNLFEFRNFLNNNSSNRVVLRDQDKNPNVFKGTEMSFSRRLTYSGQFSGEHFMGDDNQSLDWTVGYSFADKSEPDQKQYEYTQDENGEFFLPFYSTWNVSRISNYLREHIPAASLNYSRKFHWIQNLPTEIKTGLYAEYKSRSFDNRWFAYFPSKPGTLIFDDLSINQIMNGDYFHNGQGGIKIREVTERSNSYNASNLLAAAYLGIQQSLFRSLSLNLGLRAEENIQRLDGYQQNTGSVARPLVINTPTFNLFPSAMLTYSINKRHQLRMAYSSSINRPEFREIAPYAYYEFENDVTVNGNPNLKDCHIQGLDLRYEFYPENASNIFSTALFAKRFTNMIELAQQGSTYPVTYNYVNVSGGDCYGIELDMRQQLGKSGWLKNLTLMLNASWIYSIVDYNTGFEKRQRPMQGQSPFIINSGLFYNDKDNGLNVNVVYNVVGKRLVVNGDYSSVTDSNPDFYIPDTYEMPRHQLDLNISKTFGKWEVRFSAKDLINNNLNLLQTYPNGYKAYRQISSQGRKFLLSVGLSL